MSAGEGIPLDVTLNNKRRVIVQAKFIVYPMHGQVDITKYYAWLDLSQDVFHIIAKDSMQQLAQNDDAPTKHNPHDCTEKVNDNVDTVETWGLEESSPKKGRTKRRRRPNKSRNSIDDTKLGTKDIASPQLIDDSVISVGKKPQPMVPSLDHTNKEGQRRSSSSQSVDGCILYMGKKPAGKKPSMEITAAISQHQSDTSHRGSLESVNLMTLLNGKTLSMPPIPAHSTYKPLDFKTLLAGKEPPLSTQEIHTPRVVLNESVEEVELQYNSPLPKDKAAATLRGAVTNMMERNSTITQIDKSSQSPIETAVPEDLAPALAAHPPTLELSKTTFTVLAVPQDSVTEKWRREDVLPFRKIHGPVQKLQMFDQGACIDRPGKGHFALSNLDLDTTRPQVAKAYNFAYLSYSTFQLFQKSGTSSSDVHDDLCSNSSMSDAEDQHQTTQRNSYLNTNCQESAPDRADIKYAASGYWPVRPDPNKMSFEEMIAPLSTSASSTLMSGPSSQTSNGEAGDSAAFDGKQSPLSSDIVLCDHQILSIGNEEFGVTEDILDLAKVATTSENAPMFKHEVTDLETMVESENYLESNDVDGANVDAGHHAYEIQDEEIVKDKTEPSSFDETQERIASTLQANTLESERHEVPRNDDTDTLGQTVEETTADMNVDEGEPDDLDVVSGEPFWVDDGYRSALFTLPDLPIDLINEYIGDYNAARSHNFTGDLDTAVEEDMQARSVALSKVGGRHDSIPDQPEYMVIASSEIRAHLQSQEPHGSLSQHSRFAFAAIRRCLLMQQLRQFSWGNPVEMRVVSYKDTFPVINKSDWQDFHHINAWGDIMAERSGTPPELSMYMILALHSTNRFPRFLEKTTAYYLKQVLVARAYKHVDPIQYDFSENENFLMESIEDGTVTPASIMSRLQGHVKVAYPPLGSWQHDDYTGTRIGDVLGEWGMKMVQGTDDAVAEVGLIKDVKPTLIEPEDDRFFPCDALRPCIAGVVHQDIRPPYMPQILTWCAPLSAPSRLRITEISTTQADALAEDILISDIDNLERTIPGSSCEQSVVDLDDALHVAEAATNEICVDGEMTVETPALVDDLTDNEAEDEAVTPTLAQFPADANTKQAKDGVDGDEIEDLYACVNLYYTHHAETYLESLRPPSPDLHDTWDIFLPLSVLDGDRKAKLPTSEADKQQDSYEEKSVVKILGEAQLALPFEALIETATDLDTEVKFPEPCVQPSSSNVSAVDTFKVLKEEKPFAPNTKKKVSRRKNTDLAISIPGQDAALRQTVANSTVKQGCVTQQSNPRKASTAEKEAVMQKKAVTGKKVRSNKETSKQKQLGIRKRSAGKEGRIAALPSSAIGASTSTQVPASVQKSATHEGRKAAKPRAVDRSCAPRLPQPLEEIPQRQDEFEIVLDLPSLSAIEDRVRAAQATATVVFTLSEAEQHAHLQKVLLFLLVVALLGLWQIMP